MVRVLDHFSRYQLNNCRLLLILMSKLTPILTLHEELRTVHISYGTATQTLKLHFQIKLKLSSLCRFCSRLCVLSRGCMYQRNLPRSLLELEPSGGPARRGGYRCIMGKNGAPHSRLQYVVKPRPAAGAGKEENRVCTPPEPLAADCCWPSPPKNIDNTHHTSELQMTAI